MPSEDIAVEQGSQEGDAESAGEMVVAGPGAVQRVGDAALAQRGDRQRRGDEGERLQRGADLGAPLFLSTLYFHQERGYDALTTGLALLPSVCMGLIAAPVFSRVAARTGPYVPMTLGLFLGALGFLGWLLARPGTAYPVLLFALIATGLGQTLAALASMAAVVESAPADGAGVAAAVFNVSRQVGSAVGVALFGTVVAGCDHFTDGLHVSAAVAAAAFLTGGFLAIGARRRVAAAT
ncbi:MFS transporter [Streptomyces syringium]|uniref:MFS transporter n=1 Tax=Streptomyces syringium TaxID=76729 RepID=UPI00343DB835